MSAGFTSPRARARLAAVVAVLTAGLIGPPTAAAVEPVFKNDNPSCQEISGNETWAEYKIEPIPKGPITTFTNGAISGVITVDAEGRYFGFVVTPGVDAVIVKGGNNANVYYYDPDAITDSGLHAPINLNPNHPDQGKPFGLSHISFCYGPDAPGGFDPPPGDKPPVTETNGPPSQNPNGPPPETLPPVETPPEGGIRGIKQRSGVARIQARSGCANDPFDVRVSGRRIQRVAFSIDGRRVKVDRSTHGGRLATLRVNPRAFAAGIHRVVARVRFTRGSITRSRVLRSTFNRCVRKLRDPRFTG